MVVPFVDICGIVDRHCFDLHNARVETHPTEPVSLT